GAVAGGVCAKASAGRRSKSTRIRFIVPFRNFRPLTGMRLMEALVQENSTGTGEYWRPVLREQQFEGFALAIAEQAVGAAEDSVCQVTFGFLQLKYLFFDGVAGNQAVGEHRTRLADSVCTVYGLGFHGGIPPGIEEEDVFGSREIEAQTTSLKTDEK